MRSHAISFHRRALAATMRSAIIGCLCVAASAYFIPTPPPAARHASRCVSPILAWGKPSAEVAEAKSVAPLSAEDEEKLLLTEPGLNAFITAEVRSFVSSAMEAKAIEDAENLKRCPWLKVRSEAEEEEAAAAEAFGSKAVDEICAAASEAFGKAHADGLLGKGKDHYELLGIDRTATDADVKRAYKELAIALHPDRNPTASDEEKEAMDVQFKELGEALAVLSDPMRKRRYFNTQDSREEVAEKALPYLKNVFSMRMTSAPALKRVGLSDDEVSKHISDMYHHRVFRDTQPGRLCRRAGEPPRAVCRHSRWRTVITGVPRECAVWGPNEICLQTVKEAEEAKKRRFEIQIEGTRGLGHR